MPEKLLYRNARDAILALSTSRKDIDDDAAGTAAGVAEEKIGVLLTPAQRGWDVLWLVELHAAEP